MRKCHYAIILQTSAQYYKTRRKVLKDANNGCKDEGNDDGKVDE